MDAMRSSDVNCTADETYIVETNMRFPSVIVEPLKFLALVATVTVLLPEHSHAESRVVSNYGVAASAMPYAVALHKGFFNEANVEVDAIVDIEGDAAIRTLLKDKLAYAEVSAAATVTAIRSGLPIKIVSGNVQTVVDYVWVALPSSSINSMSDLKGKRVGYSNSGATTEALDTMLLDAASISANDVSLIRTGGVLPELTFLELKGIDVVPIPEPIRSKVAGKYKVIAAAADVLPKASDVLGVTTDEALRTRAAFISGILRARRKAIAYMRENPVESAAIIAAAYKSDPQTIERIIRGYFDGEKQRGEPYWDSDGKVRLDLLNSLPRGDRTSGTNSADIELSKHIAESLPTESVQPR